MFCYKCLAVLFGSRTGYWSFVKSQRRYRTVERQRREKAEMTRRAESCRMVAE